MNETKPLEILIIEDDSRHIEEAHNECKQYNKINFHFVCTLEETKSYIKEQKVDAVISDVFFPQESGQEPTDESGLEIAKCLINKNIPFVFNTSTYHHGSAGSIFVDKYRKLVENILQEKRRDTSACTTTQILEGKVLQGSGYVFEVGPIEAGINFGEYPTLDREKLYEISSSIAHKKWKKAIDYLILLVEKLEKK